MANQNATQILENAFRNALRGTNPDYALDHGRAIDTARLLPRIGRTPAGTNKHKAETALSAILQGLALYAEAHAAAYESPIGEDGVLGDHWLEIARGLAGLLNGEHGRLDAGAMDAAIRNLALASGATPEEINSI
jgi:hypothetical protein